MHVLRSLQPNGSANTYGVCALWKNDGDNMHAAHALTSELTYLYSVTVGPVGPFKQTGQTII